MDNLLNKGTSNKCDESHCSSTTDDGTETRDEENSNKNIENDSISVVETEGGNYANKSDDLSRNNDHEDDNSDALSEVFNFEDEVTTDINQQEVNEINQSNENIDNHDDDGSDVINTASKVLDMQFSSKN